MSNSLPPRVYISVFGSGLGHAARMIPVGNSLAEQGMDVLFSSSSEAVDLIRKSGFQCFETPSIDVAWAPDGSVAPLRITIRRITKNIPTFWRQVGIEMRRMNKLRPQIVLADSKLSTIIAAKLLGIPTILVLNQLRILLPDDVKTRMRTVLERLTTEVLSILWNLSKCIVIPDLPPPYTIALRNTSGIILGRRKIKFVGFITKNNHIDEDECHLLRERLKITKRTPLVFAQISGPPPTKKPLIEAVTHSAKDLQKYCVIVVSEGDPHGNEDPVWEGWGWRYGWCPENETLFTLADLLVIRGGHSSISKALLSSKPVVVVPIERHSEQYHNAIRLNSLEVGLVVEQKNLPNGSLVDAIKSISTDDKFKISAKRLGAIAVRMNGVKGIVEEVHKHLR